jgi:hypothetical protein
MTSTATSIYYDLKTLYVDNLRVFWGFKFLDNGTIPTTGHVMTAGIDGTVKWAAPTGGGSTGLSSQWTTNGTAIYYNTGNVGIGVSGPTEKLSIVGDIGITGNIQYPEAAGFSLQNDSAVKLFNITPAGRIGLGITNPSTAIHLNGDTRIDGNLTVSGTVTTISTTDLVVQDPLIKLADGNVADIVDIGLYGMYNNGTTGYAGLFRDASDSRWKLFATTTQPGTTVDTAAGGYAAADMTLGDLRPTTVSGTPTFTGAYTVFNNTVRALQSVVVETTPTETFSGSLTTTSGAAGITGVGTLFTRELAVGDLLTIGVTGEIRAIAGITDNSRLTLSSALGSTSSGITGTVTHAPLSVATSGSTGPLIVVGPTGFLGVGTALPTSPVYVATATANNWSGQFSNGGAVAKFAYDAAKAIYGYVDDTSVAREALVIEGAKYTNAFRVYADGRVLFTGTTGYGFNSGTTGSASGFLAGNAATGPDRSGSSNTNACFYNTGASVGQEAITQDALGNTTIAGSSVYFSATSMGITGALTVQDIYSRVITSSAGTYTLSDSDRAQFYIFTGASPTITLPLANASSYARELMVIFEGSGTATVQRQGSDTIDGITTTSFVLQTYERVRLLSNNSSIWYSV